MFCDRQDANSFHNLRNGSFNHTPFQTQQSLTADTCPESGHGGRVVGCCGLILAPVSQMLLLDGKRFKPVFVDKLLPFAGLVLGARKGIHVCPFCC